MLKIAVFTEQRHFLYFPRQRNQFLQCLLVNFVAVNSTKSEMNLLRSDLKDVEIEIFQCRQFTKSYIACVIALAFVTALTYTVIFTRIMIRSGVT